MNTPPTPAHVATNRSMTHQSHQHHPQAAMAAVESGVGVQPYMWHLDQSDLQAGLHQVRGAFVLPGCIACTASIVCIASVLYVVYTYLYCLSHLTNCPTVVPQDTRTCMR